MSGRGVKRPNYGKRIPKVMTNGYVREYLPEHPLADKVGHVLQHRRIAWDAGILTDPSWHVHHKNHDRTDNRLENLETLPQGTHMRERHCHDGALIQNQHGTFVAGSGIDFQRRAYKASLGPRSCKKCGVDISDRRVDAVVCSKRCGR